MWIILTIIAIVAIFVILNQRMRCPNCGLIAFHVADKKSNKKDKELKEMIRKTGLDKLNKNSRKSMGLNTGNFWEKVFICKDCGHRFDREKSRIWANISRKHGDDKAIQKHQKIINK